MRQLKDDMQLLEDEKKNKEDEVELAGTPAERDIAARAYSDVEALLKTAEQQLATFDSTMRVTSEMTATNARKNGDFHGEARQSPIFVPAHTGLL